MGKRETKETYKDSKAFSEDATKSYKPIIEQAGERGDQYYSGIGAQKDYLSGAYKGMFEGTNAPESLSFGRMGGVGKIDTADIRNTLEGYKGFRDTGGLSNENIERMRGMGGFDEFAKTGGYTAPQLANIKAQAISPIGSYATGTRDELARRRAVQGGYAPGFDAANRQLQRDTARAIADTSLNANIQLQDRINQGRQWGISGLTGAEQALAGMQTGNRLSALGGEGTMSQAISDASARDIANQMMIEQFNAQMAAQEAQFNASRGDAYKQMGMSGLQDLYGMDIGLQQSEYDRQAQLLQDLQRSRSGYLGTQSDLAKQPGIGGNILAGVGAAAGIAGGMMTGGLAPAIGGIASGLMNKGGGLSSMNGEWTGNENVTRGWG